MSKFQAFHKNNLCYDLHSQSLKLRHGLFGFVWWLALASPVSSLCYQEGGCCLPVFKTVFCSVGIKLFHSKRKKKKKEKRERERERERDMSWLLTACLIFYNDKIVIAVILYLYEIIDNPMFVMH